jgi:single-strand DNA-binding protein
MKNITVAGRLTKDAEIKQAQRDDFLQFSVAVDDFNGKDKSTLFFDVSMFGKRIQTLQQYLTKGTSVAVAGDFGINEYNGKTYLKIRANEVTLQGGGNRKPADTMTAHNGEKYDRADVLAHVRRSHPLDDDIPFAPEWRG